MSTVSLWPDFPTRTRRHGVKQMLEEAGGDLLERTDGVVAFVVRPTGQDANDFFYTCYLTVEGANVEYPLLRVRSRLSGFPAEVISTDCPGEAAVTDEGGLRRRLAEIFQSERVKQIVTNLIANFG